MAPAPKKNEVFGDYAAFLNALLPQAVGFMFHDRHGRLFWHDRSPDISQLNDEYHTTLSKMLTHGELPGEEGRIHLRDCTAYLVRIVSDKGRVLGVLTALANVEMSGMPYTFCCDLLKPALRSLSRELSLRVHLLDVTNKLNVHSGEHSFLKVLSEKARSSNSCNESLRSILDMTLEHLMLDGAVLLAPGRAIAIETGANPVDMTEAELLLDAMRDIADENKDNVADALANRPAPDPRERSRVWPIISDGKRLTGILVLSRSTKMVRLTDHSVSLASFVASTVEHVIERGFDSLTGLISWPGFEHSLEIACQEGGENHSLMYMDIDQLHVVNDTFGRSTGDEILLSFAAIIRSVLPGQIITRVTSDSFAAMLKDVDLDEAQSLGKEICLQLRNLDYANGNQKFRPSASIGVAPLTPSAEEIHSVLVPAQVACQAAKDRGRSRCEIFQSSDTSIVRRMDELSLVGSIQSAIEGGRLVLYAQPIIKTDNVTDFAYFEILVRMLNPAGEALKPSEFLGAAERYQLMQELDRWVVNKAIDTLIDKGVDASGKPLHFSVNLSGQSLGNDQFLDFVRGELSRSGVSPDRLCFEITETVAVANLQKAQLFMDELKRIGCQFSLDDFGTGLSSFAYLKLFAVDQLKIDGGFIKDIAENELSQSMVSAIVEIARVMNIQTVAEHVQDEVTLSVIRDLGIDWAQGYHVGEPVRLGSLFANSAVADMATLEDVDATILLSEIC
ncbi:MAG: EAL domain-containing protein [Gammaproteobacteria bacterium]|nr:EAL domain-containing protein [Gammaproteobacteria bacterium]MCP4091490.1 EAL domain-containing protein [Gammaproteobacteria bacterium]MCP4275400.1 EAL domain-containing protein [Gammaproteobacteria bacterium]MCP4832288.1 EAL domain-containing protein [Gammaproteobacteria bacterium]MCP4928137.1 EAL domain-containing protein [Gammaproteobacteria bacterium]